MFNYHSQLKSVFETLTPDELTKKLSDTDETMCVLASIRRKVNFAQDILTVCNAIKDKSDPDVNSAINNIIFNIKEQVKTMSKEMKTI